MSQNENHPANILSGILLGALIGGGLGLGVCVYLFDEPPFFVGDTILIGAIACGTLGYLLGEEFIEWLRENWWWFW